MSAFELAQVNIAKFRGALDSPVMKDFSDALDRINALADTSPGFRWRLQTEDGNAMALRFFDADTFVNLSVWQDLESLRQYVYRSDHVAFLRRRTEWAHRMEGAHLALWWVPAGHRPSLKEAQARLEQLRAEGPSARAFDFARPRPAPDDDPTTTASGRA